MNITVVEHSVQLTTTNGRPVNVAPTTDHQVNVAIEENTAVIVEPKIPGMPGTDGSDGHTPIKGVDYFDGEPGAQGPPGTDLTYTQEFTVSNALTVTHNLNKFPNVTVIDSAEDVVEVDVQYIDLNTLSVFFSGAFSGKIICN